MGIHHAKRDHEKAAFFQRKCMAVINNTVESLKLHPDIIGDVIGRCYHQGVTDGVRWETARTDKQRCKYCDGWFEVEYTTGTWWEVKFCPLCGTEIGVENPRGALAEKIEAGQR